MMRADRYCDDATCNTLFSVLLHVSQTRSRFSADAAVSHTGKPNQYDHSRRMYAPGEKVISRDGNRGCHEHLSAPERQKTAPISSA